MEGTSSGSLFINLTLASVDASGGHHNRFCGARPVRSRPDVRHGVRAPAEHSSNHTVGSNFRLGARVVISSAADIRIESVSRISSTVINAVITVGDRAAEGVRTVDVFNTDGTNTLPMGGLGDAEMIPGSSKPLRVTSHSSLGARWAYKRWS